MIETLICIQPNKRRKSFRSESNAVENRKRKRGYDDRDARFSYANSLVILITSMVAIALLSEPTSAAAWLSEKQSTSFTEKDTRCSYHRMYSSPRPQETSRRKDSTSHAKSKRSKLRFEDGLSASSDNLDSLLTQAAKLRNEAESLQSALQESKEAKMQRELDKIDGWIDELLIEAKCGDGTELLKTVDQVYDVMMKERYSANHVLKIFERLCDIRMQESRSNCSPLMELLVDATGKLDCTEREDCPNKRWNHKVERVLRRKLFARDWNIHYVSDDEEFW